MVGDRERYGVREARTAGPVWRVLNVAIFGLIDAAADPLKERHAAELTELEARVSQMGERGSGRKVVDDRTLIVFQWTYDFKAANKLLSS